jgi:hypothetical protein
MRRHLLSLLVGAATLVPVIGACNAVFGLSDGQLDQQTSDYPCLDAAAVDAHAADGALFGPLEQVCKVYCDCMNAFCGNVVPEGQACLDICKSLTCSAIACRTEHCVYAPESSEPSLHCSHAGGKVTGVCTSP